MTVKGLYMKTYIAIMAMVSSLLFILPSSVIAGNKPFAASADPVMSTDDENRQMLDWVSRSFQNGGKEGKFNFFFATRIPFSFTYGATLSSELLPLWQRTSKTNDEKDYTTSTVSWSDPKTGLVVTAEVKAYKQYPAADWVLYFENRGKEDTPIIENIQAMDMLVNTETTDLTYAVLHKLNGDETGVVGEESFMPEDVPVYGGRTVRLAPSGGRPSSGEFPFFNYEDANSGVIAAIGWTGQWAFSVEHTMAGPSRLVAGMEHTHLLLHPGEKIRSPRILVLRWKGDRTRAQNQFRRLMMEQYSPRPGGEPVKLPIALQTFDRYRNSPGWGTEAGQLKGVEAAHELGFDSYWLDATWYAGGFPNGAGNWYVDTKAFPNGLKPLSDACHKYGMRFILWFDPERVMPGTQIDTEHPDWVLKRPNDRGVFNLGDPNARRWLTDLISKRIDEFGLDVYRQDSNILPLPYWKANDAPDRQGMTEIRHVEGLYAMWDELIAKHPNLLIDNCQSGGRRIDIETCKRSVPLWRSDSGCWECPPEWNQVQTFGFCQYVPLQTGGIQVPDAYSFRSVATGGAVCEFGYMDAGFSQESAKAAIVEAKENSKYWTGDFYPLTTGNIAEDHLMAFQLHRPDLDEGMILAFRRENCRTKGIVVPLGGVLSNHKYVFEFIDDSRKVVARRTILGKKLISDGLQIVLDRPKSSLLIRYKGKASEK
jgi:alpha-galactosidase